MDEEEAMYALDAYSLFGEVPRDNIYIALGGLGVNGSFRAGGTFTIEQAQEFRATLKDAIKTAKAARAREK